MMGAGADSGGDDNADSRKIYGKRELSTSKRAAQNRAAQVGLIPLLDLSGTIARNASRWMVSDF